MFYSKLNISARVFNQGNKRALISTILSHHFVCKCLDNVHLHTIAKFDQNRPSGSTIMNILSN